MAFSKLMDFREYETAVAKFLIKNNPEYKCEYNVMLDGKISKRKRQVDILLREKKTRQVLIVECKYYEKKITVKDADSFIGFMEDIGFSDGLLITNVGASNSANNRIALSSIRIRIIDDNALSHYRIGGLIPFTDNRIAFLPEPNGWVMLEHTPDFPVCCFLSLIGNNFQESQPERWEFSIH